MEAKLRALWISAVDASEKSASWYGRGKRPQYTLDGNLGRLQGRFRRGGEENNSCPCRTSKPGPFLPKLATSAMDLRGCIQKFPECVGNEIYAYNNKQSLENNTKGYGGKTH
jgi:hypothetical protein